MPRPTPASSLLVSALVAGLAWFSGPERAAGQTSVTGRVTDAETARALEGVVVRLIDPDAALEEDREVAGTFTSARGRFRLEPERPGRYRLEAERIGYRAYASGTFLAELGGHHEHDVALRPEGVRLSALEVTSRRRCSVDPAKAEGTHRVWREARRALELAQWTAEHSSVEVRTRNFERRLDSDLDVEETLEQTRGFGFGATPYRSLPADELSERGYADARGDYIDYYAPDARALLSDAFQRDHCFWLTREDAPRDGWIGLAFEPVEGRDVPEIEGVLWLDEETGELKRLEFEYVDLPLPTSEHAAGGEIGFFRLPTGPWVVRRWSIRMPQVEREDLRIGAYHREEFEVAGYEQEGGRVLRISDGGRTLYDFEEATLAGVVRDSVRGGPLEGAAVELVGTGRADTTDARGRFRFTGVPEGGYRVRFRHPFLAGLGIEPPTVRVDVQPGELVTARLASPGSRAAAREVCPDSGPAAGAVAGRVRTKDGRAVPGARVAAVWPTEERREGEPDDYVHREVRTDGRGSFRICGVPPGRELALRAEHETGVGGVTRTRLPDRGLAVRDLQLEPGGDADRLAAFIREQGLGGGPVDGGARDGSPGTVRGTVRASTGDRPLSAAEVFLGDERRAVTDSAGRFRVEGVEPGRRRLRVSYLGFRSQEALLRVPAADTVESTILMETEPVPLPELAVRVRAGGIAGLGKRRRRGVGHFLTREEIASKPGDDVADALRGVPGIQVVPCPGGGAGDCVRTTRSRQTRLTTRTPARERELSPAADEGGGGGRPGPMGREIPIPDRDTLPQGRPCGIAFFVDGAPVDLMGRDPGDPANPAKALFGLGGIPKEDVEAIEVYTGPAQIPVRFKNAATGCAKAAVVIWTRGAVR